MDEFSHITEELEVIEKGLKFRFNKERRANSRGKAPKAENFELMRVRRAFHFNKGSRDHIVLTIPQPEYLLLISKKRTVAKCKEAEIIVDASELQLDVTSAAENVKESHNNAELQEISITKDLQANTPALAEERQQNCTKTANLHANSDTVINQSQQVNERGTYGIVEENCNSFSPAHEETSEVMLTTVQEATKNRGQFDEQLSIRSLKPASTDSGIVNGNESMSNIEHALIVALRNSDPDKLSTANDLQNNPSCTAIPAESINMFPKVTAKYLTKSFDPITQKIVKSMDTGYKSQEISPNNSSNGTEMSRNCIFSEDNSHSNTNSSKKAVIIHENFIIKQRCHDVRLSTGTEDYISDNTMNKNVFEIFPKSTFHEENLIENTRHSIENLPSHEVALEKMRATRINGISDNHSSAEQICNDSQVEETFACQKLCQFPILEKFVFNEVEIKVECRSMSPIEDLLFYPTEFQHRTNLSYENYGFIDAKIETTEETEASPQIDQNAAAEICSVQPKTDFHEDNASPDDKVEETSILRQCNFQEYQNLREEILEVHVKCEYSDEEMEEETLNYFADNSEEHQNVASKFGPNEASSLDNKKEEIPVASGNSEDHQTIGEEIVPTAESSNFYYEKIEESEEIPFSHLSNSQKLDVQPDLNQQDSDFANEKMAESEVPISSVINSQSKVHSKEQLPAFAEEKVKESEEMPGSTNSQKLQGIVGDIQESKSTSNEKMCNFVHEQMKGAEEISFSSPNNSQEHQRAAEEMDEDHLNSAFSKESSGSVYEKMEEVTLSSPSNSQEHQRVTEEVLEDHLTSDHSKKSSSCVESEEITPSFQNNSQQHQSATEKVVEDHRSYDLNKEISGCVDEGVEESETNSFNSPSNCQEHQSNAEEILQDHRNHNEKIEELDGIALSSSNNSLNHQSAAEEAVEDHLSSDLNKKSFGCIDEEMEASEAIPLPSPTKVSQEHQSIAKEILKDHLQSDPNKEHYGFVDKKVNDSKEIFVPSDNSSKRDAEEILQVTNHSSGFVDKNIKETEEIPVILIENLMQHTNTAEKIEDRSEKNSSIDEEKKEESIESRFSLPDRSTDHSSRVAEKTEEIHVTLLENLEQRLSGTNKIEDHSESDVTEKKSGIDNQKKEESVETQFSLPDRSTGEILQVTNHNSGLANENIEEIHGTRMENLKQHSSTTEKTEDQKKNTGIDDEKKEESVDTQLSLQERSAEEILQVTHHSSSFADENMKKANETIVAAAEHLKQHPRVIETVHNKSNFNEENKESEENSDAFAAQSQNHESKSEENVGTHHKSNIDPSNDGRYGFLHEERDTVEENVQNSAEKACAIEEKQIFNLPNASTEQKWKKIVDAFEEIFQIHQNPTEKNSEIKNNIFNLPGVNSGANFNKKVKKSEDGFEENLQIHQNFVETNCEIEKDEIFSLEDVGSDVHFFKEVKKLEDGYCTEKNRKIDEQIFNLQDVNSDANLDKEVKTCEDRFEENSQTFQNFTENACQGPEEEEELIFSLEGIDSEAESNENTLDNPINDENVSRETPNTQEKAEEMDKITALERSSSDFLGFSEEEVKGALLNSFLINNFNLHTCVIKRHEEIKTKRAFNSESFKFCEFARIEMKKIESFLADARKKIEESRIFSANITHNNTNVTKEELKSPYKCILTAKSLSASYEDLEEASTNQNNRNTSHCDNFLTKSSCFNFSYGQEKEIVANQVKESLKDEEVKIVCDKSLPQKSGSKETTQDNLGIDTKPSRKNKDQASFKVLGASTRNRKRSFDKDFSSVDEEIVKIHKSEEKRINDPTERDFLNNTDGKIALISSSEANQDEDSINQSFSYFSEASNDSIISERALEAAVSKENINYNEMSGGTSNNNKKLFKCDQCDFKVNKESYFKLHIRVHILPYWCNICSETFPDTTTLQQHMIDSHNSCYKNCKKCHDGEKHCHNSTGKKPYKCGFCDYATWYLFRMSHHMKMHSKEKLHMCDKCSFITPTEVTLKRHQDSHLKLELFECDECGFITVNQDGLEVHQLIHSGNKLHKCDKCSFSTAHVGYFNAHRSFHKKSVKKEPVAESKTKLRCEECEYSTLRRSALERHGKKFGHPVPSAVPLYKAPKHRDSKPYVILSKNGFMCSKCRTMCVTRKELELHESNVHCSGV